MNKQSKRLHIGHLYIQTHLMNLHHKVFEPSHIKNADIEFPHPNAMLINGQPSTNQTITIVAGMLKDKKNPSTPLGRIPRMLKHDYAPPLNVWQCQEGIISTLMWNPAFFVGIVRGFNVSLVLIASRKCFLCKFTSKSYDLMSTLW